MKDNPRLLRALGAGIRKNRKRPRPGTTPPPDCPATGDWCTTPRMCMACNQTTIGEHEAQCPNRPALGSSAPEIVDPGAG